MTLVAIPTGPPFPRLSDQYGPPEAFFDCTSLKISLVVVGTVNKAAGDFDTEYISRPHQGGWMPVIL